MSSYPDIDLGDFDIDYSKKKKKKAKAAIASIEDTIKGTETAIAYNDAMAQVLHAKAISADATAIAMEAHAVAMVAEAVAQKYEETASALNEDLEVLQLKKKKKKRAFIKQFPEDEIVTTEAALDDDPEPTYDQMLSRIYEKLQADRPGLIGDAVMKRVKPPSLSRLGTKKTCWTNFSDYEVSLNRSSEHLQSFVLSELGTTGSIDGSNQLILKTIIKSKNVENLLRKYIEDYVRCRNCKGIETDLVKDSTSRLHFIQCKRCLSSRSVAAIKAGYQATTKADRKAAREE